METTDKRASHVGCLHCGQPVGQGAIFSGQYCSDECYYDARQHRHHTDNELREIAKATT